MAWVHLRFGHFLIFFLLFSHYYFQFILISNEPNEAIFFFSTQNSTLVLSIEFRRFGISGFLLNLPLSCGGLCSSIEGCDEANGRIVFDINKSFSLISSSIMAQLQSHKHSLMPMISILIYIAWITILQM